MGSARDELKTMRAYWVLATVIFLGFTAGGATMPFFSLYATSLGASLGQVALVVGVQSAVAVVAGLAWGRVADRFGHPRPIVTGALAGLAVLNFAIANAPTWQWLVPLHALLGVAMGAYHVTSLALMGDILEGNPRRGRLVSGYRMSGSLAFSVAIVLSGWLSETIGPRGSFLLAAGVYALAFLISLFIVAPPRVAPIAKPAGFATLLRGPMRPLLIVALAFGVPFSAVYSVWPIWVVDVLGLSRGDLLPALGRRRLRRGAVYAGGRHPGRPRRPPPDLRRRPDRLRPRLPPLRLGRPCPACTRRRCCAAWPSPPSPRPR